MENEPQFAIDTNPGAQLEAETQPRASDSESVKKDSVRVRVHDTTPLLQRANEGSGYEAVRSSDEDTGRPGRDNAPSWRQTPSVS